MKRYRFGVKNRKTLRREFFFVFRNNIPLDLAVMQVESDIVQAEAVVRIAVQRKFKKRCVVRFLYDIAVRSEDIAVDREKTFVRKAVFCVGVFRERAAEIEVDTFNALRLEHLFEIFRHAHYVFQIFQSARAGAFHCRNQHVHVLLYRDEVYVGIAARDILGELTLSAAYFEVDRIIVPEHFFGGYYFGRIYSALFRSVVLKPAEIYCGAGGKPFVKMLLFSHSHVQ